MKRNIVLATVAAAALIGGGTVAAYAGSGDDGASPRQSDVRVADDRDDAPKDDTDDRDDAQDDRDDARDDREEAAAQARGADVTAAGVLRGEAEAGRPRARHPPDHLEHALAEVLPRHLHRVVEDPGVLGEVLAHQLADVGVLAVQQGGQGRDVHGGLHVVGHERHSAATRHGPSPGCPRPHPSGPASGTRVGQGRTA